jgi:hypothetical protein
MKTITSKNAAAAVATATNNNESTTSTNPQSETAIMKNSTTAVAAAINAPVARPVAYDMSRVISTMMTMSSTILTDYLTMFYADTATAVTEGSLAPVVKLILDKGFARHWTEHNSTHSRIETETLKLASIREVIKYWNMNVLTKSAYEAATRPAPEPKPAKTPRAAGGASNVLKVLADRITSMSLSVEVELTDRAAYAKIANALSLTNGRAMYDTLMTLPKAAAIIVAAETAIEADKQTELAEAQRLADIEAQTMAAELADMFG